jgi:hypothetical protein
VNLSLSIQIVPIGNKFVAISKVGGFTVRGKSAESAELAIRNLFFALVSSSASSSPRVASSLSSTIETALLDAGKTS